MNILLTNDDGYDSVGLQQLCQALSNIDNVNVYVVAPNTQKSGYSHAMQFHTPVIVNKLDSYYGAVEAYTCSGTPANCTNYALKGLCLDIDLVISGPNAGPNYGYDILYSGTAGGAEEAVVKGVKGVAVSLNVARGSKLDFTNTVSFVVDNLDKLYSYSVPNTYLNINVPDTDTILGTVVADQSDKTLFDDYYEIAPDGSFSLEGGFSAKTEGCDDVAMCNKGYVTLTAISLLRTSKAGNDSIAKIFKS